MFDILKGKMDQVGKSQEQQYFTCNLFLGLDKNTGALVYVNLDAMIG